jgi:NAD(P)-dependent dehydrogenase (short-subunit alcohol dehydrogenase family)
MERVVLVTGAGSGLGRACVEYLARKGHRVYGGDVDPRPVNGVTMLRMDVTIDRSAAGAIDWITEEAGRIDVLINNAGFGIAGSIEDTSIEEAHRQFEVNFFGIFRMTRAALPQMRRQGNGLIINVSSIGGLIAMPFQGLYSASKFAVEGFTEALRMEVRPFGISAVLVEPADFHTGFTAARRLVDAATEKSAYAPRLRDALAVIEADELDGSHPRLVGPLIEKIMRSRHPRLRYMVGSRTEQLAALLKRALPASAFAPLIENHYRVGR